MLTALLRRENVSSWHIDGEILASIRFTANTLVGEQKVITLGDSTANDLDRHSIALLTALASSELLQRMASTIPTLVTDMMDKNLFATATETDVATDFLRQLLRHQYGRVWDVPTPDRMIDRYAADLELAAAHGALAAKPGLARALTIFAMQAYAETRLSADEQLFTAVNGGVQFDIHDVADQLDENKGYGKSFRTYLQALKVSELERIDERLADTVDWIVQSGSQALQVSTGERAAFVLGGDGADHVEGGAAADLMHGGKGDDMLAGGAGDDMVLGGEGDDTLAGDDGDDTLSGGFGADSLDGGDGVDTLEGGDGNDMLKGAAGDDTIKGEDGDDQLDGGANADTLDGGFGDDKLDGGAGADTLKGGAGNDELTGGAGADTLDGGRGYDTYIYKSGSGRDVITDTSGQILLDGEQLTGGRRGSDEEIYHSRDRKHSYSWSGGDLTIDGTITVANFRRGDLGIFLDEGRRADDTRPIWSPYYQGMRTLSPLVLDLDGNGIDTVGSADGAYFDFDGDGMATRTGWVGSNDGLLVMDRNGNGRVDNGSELFGNNVLDSNGDYMANGFEAVAQQDSNGDGHLSADDQNWSKLQVWRDANGDGYTDAGELWSLAAANVADIGLDYRYYDGIYDNLNLHLQHGQYTLGTGGVREITDVWFKVDLAITINTDPTPLSAATAWAPNVEGLGWVPELRRALAGDLSGKLAALTQRFATEPDAAKRGVVLDALLGEWTGTADVVDGSRGVHFSAKKISILERFMGEKYNQNSVDNNPGVNSAEFLETSYTMLHERYNALFAAETFLKPYYEQITYTRDAVTHGLAADLLPVVGAFKAALTTDAGAGANALIEFARTLKHAPVAASVNYAEFGAAFADQPGPLRRALASALEGFVATGGQDFMAGTRAAEVLAGMGGVDVLRGGSGDDVIEGGAGDDVIDAGGGDDTLYFGRGDGLDTVTASDWDSRDTGKNTDTLRFLAGINPADVTLAVNNSDLVIKLDGGPEGMVLSEWFKKQNRVDRIEFDNGVTWDLAFILDRVASAGDGDDTLFGDAEANVISGLDGDDALYGRDGDDILRGGAGNDRLSGGMGSDTFVYSRGDGSDEIDTDDAEYWSGTTDVDVLRFEQGIEAADVRISRDRLHTYLSIRDTNDRITLNNWNVSWAKVGRVEFSDGTVWDTEYIKAQSAMASASDDYLEGTADADHLAGLAGADMLFGGDGDDVLDGGAGDDELNGEAGIDTYLYGYGDGFDVVRGNQWAEGASGEILQFKQGVGESDVQFSRMSRDLMISFDGHDGGVRLSDWFEGGERVGEIRFADGTAWDEQRLLDILSTPTEHGDELPGGFGDDILTGLGGNDYLLGREGNDTLVGGKGDDYLDGDQGDDVYLFGAGDGADTISEYNEMEGNVDVIRFGEGISSDDVVLSHDDGSSLYLTLKVSGDSIQVRGWDDDYAKIERVEFADGTHWDLVQRAANVVWIGGDGSGSGASERIAAGNAPGLSAWAVSAAVLEFQMTDDAAAGQTFDDAGVSIAHLVASEARPLSAQLRGDSTHRAVSL
jgi:Ca2+-binding RTX toxin-like protein